MTLDEITSLSDDELRVKVAKLCDIIEQDVCPSCALGRGQGHASFCAHVLNFPAPDVQAEGRGEFSRLQGFIAAFGEIEEMRADAGKKLTGRASRKHHKLSAYKHGYYDGLLAAYCMSALGECPNVEHNSEVIRKYFPSQSIPNKPHNPDNLQSPGDGYRFLDEDEIQSGPPLAEIEIYGNKGWICGSCGTLKSYTYRVPDWMTREELAKKRKEGM